MLKDIAPRIKLGLGVIDIKVNHVETADEVASRIAAPSRKPGPAASAGCTPTADSGCSNAPSPTAKSKHSSPAATNTSAADRQRALDSATTSP
jgi:methionine synthase II (cobalamin-independent)